MSSLPRHRRQDTLVSVVVPVKDTDPALLRVAVDSAVHQDCSEQIEIVVWDDGSTDPATLDALSGLARAGETGRTVRFGRTDDNRGISAARNAACRMATGTWYLWLDSDDTLPPGAVANLLDVTADRPQIVFGRCRVTWPDGRTEIHQAERFLRTWRTTRRGLDDPLLSAVFAVHGGLVHRELFRAVGGFDESLRYAELTDWVLRVMTHVDPDRVALVPEITYRYAKHAGSHSADRSELERHRMEVLRRYGESFGQPVRHRFSRRCDATGARLYDLLSDSGVSLLRPVPGS